MDYTRDPIYEWDKHKSDACKQQRNFDFYFASRVFDDPKCIIRQDDRADYGEDRLLIYGHIDNRLYCVVYTNRQGRIRIISARKANSREVNRYAYRLL